MISFFRMSLKKEDSLARGDFSLRMVSSGTKIWNQLMMFIVIGILPLAFPNLIHVRHRIVVFITVGLALLTSVIIAVDG